MATTDDLPGPSVRERIEQTLAAHPEGIAAGALRDALGRRGAALGEEPVGMHQLMRQLGLLLIEGRIDEQGGVWMLRDEQAQIADTCPHDRAA